MNVSNVIVTYPPIVVCDAGDGEVGEQVDPDPVAIDILTDVYSRMRTRGGVPVDRQRTWRVGVELRAGSTGLAASDVDATGRHDNLRNLKICIGATVGCTDHDKACRAGNHDLSKRCKKPFTTTKRKAKVSTSNRCRCKLRGPRAASSRCTAQERAVKQEA